jgi:hypothetical protein
MGFDRREKFSTESSKAGILHWDALPSQYLSRGLDLFRLLAVRACDISVPPMTDLMTLKHFFSSLPRPFIEIDQELRAEIARRFNGTNRWTQDLGTLGKVFEKAKSSEEKRVLVKLCRLLEHHPAEGSRSLPSHCSVWRCVCFLGVSLI